MHAGSGALPPPSEYVAGWVVGGVGRTACITVSARGNKTNGAALAILMTDCLRCIGNCGMTIISYSFPRCDVRSVHGHSVGTIVRSKRCGILTCRRLGQLGGGPCAVEYDHTRSTMGATRGLITTRPSLSFIFFSLPKAVGGTSIIRAVSRVSCVFAPVVTSHIIVRDSVGFTAIVGRRVVDANGSNVGKVCLI